MKSAVVFGCTGQDGGILVKLLLEKGYRVIGAKRRSSAINSSFRIDDVYNHENFSVEYFDLCDFSSIFRIISNYKPDECYNLAAQSHVKASFDVPENTLNGIINGTLNILESIRIINPKIKFYQASSSEMFGNNSDIPKNGYDETSTFIPISPYAIAKVAAHSITNMYKNSYGLFASCGILFNHEGETRSETFVTKKITTGIAKIKLGMENCLELGNLDSSRDWGYAPEYCDAIFKILQQDKPDNFVISTGKSYTVREFLEFVTKYAGLDDVYKYIRINPKYYRPEDVNFLCGNNEKARKKLNWQPTKTMQDIAKIMYDYDYGKLKNVKT